MLAGISKHQAVRHRRPFTRTLLTAALAAGCITPVCRAETGVSAAASDQKAGAQQTFDAGNKLFDSHRYEEALAAFRASYQIVASPNSRLMIARCLKELGKLPDAHREYLGVASQARLEGARYESTAKVATEEARDLEARLGFVHVSVKDADGSAAVRVAGEAVSPADLAQPVAVTPGTVVVEASVDGRTARREVEVAAGHSEDVVLDMKPVAAEAEPPVVRAASERPVPVRPASGVAASATPPTLAYVAGGVGVLGLATFGVLGAMSHSKYDGLQTSCPDRVCAEDKQADIDSGRRLQTLANVGLAVGILGIGTGVTLFLLRPGADQKKDTATVSLSVGYRSIGLKGTL